MRTLLTLGMALLALILLAASLGTLKLDPGKPMPVYQMAPDLSSEAVSDDLGRFMLAVIRILLIAGWVFLPFYIIYLIISKEARKQFIRDMMIFLPFMLFLYLLSISTTGQAVVEELGAGMNDGPLEVQEMAPGEPLPQFTEPPSWVTTVTSLVLAFGITALVLAIAFVIWRRTRRQPDSPLQMVEKEAQAAIDAIEAGGDLRETIMRCYYQMLKALSEYRNLSREQDMTPHEFEIYLQQRGMPSDPVHQLTQLFEQVRYGTHKPGRQEERAALASLAAIVSACQRARALDKQREQAREAREVR